MYEKLGFSIAPFELQDKKTQSFKSELPWDLVETIVDSGKNWKTNPKYLTKVSRASKKIYNKYSY